MSEIWSNLSGTDNRCHSYAPGHLVHWIQHKLSVREPHAVIRVAAFVDDQGVVLLEGDDLQLAMWNHRPALVRAALRRSGGTALWKPRWHLLSVPTDMVDGARNTFNLVAADKHDGCFVIPVTNPEHLIPHPPAPTNLPPLRITARYESGRPRRRATPRD